MDLHNTYPSQEAGKKQIPGFCYQMSTNMDGKYFLLCLPYAIPVLPVARKPVLIFKAEKKPTLQLEQT